MEKTVYGYVRVSSKDQNEDRQVLAMRQFGIPDERIFIEKQSGKDFNRPIYQDLLQRLNPGEISLPKWIQSHNCETAQKAIEIRHLTAFAPSSAAPGEGRFSIL